MSTIYIRVPNNKRSGGVKVANQVVNLLLDHDVRAFLVVPGEPQLADWMLRPAPVITEKQMLHQIRYEDVLVDNWNGKRELRMAEQLNVGTKVFFLQGVTFQEDAHHAGDRFLFEDIYSHFWVVSDDSLQFIRDNYGHLLPHRLFLINPYIEFEHFSAENRKGSKDKPKVLCLSRKGRGYIALLKVLFRPWLRFTVIERPFAERELIDWLLRHDFFLSTATGINFWRVWFKSLIRRLVFQRRVQPTIVINPNKEGFPLPPAEAAACGSIVCGFAAGGGLEWMSESTCFLAKDRSITSLIYALWKAIKTDQADIEQMRHRAMKAVSQFSARSTWEQLRVFLHESGVL